MMDPEVRLLQTLLIREGVYPQALVTGFYGPLTASAVKRFHDKYRIVPATSPEYDSVGTTTRAKLNERYAILFPATPIPTPTPTPAPVGTALFSKNLSRGMRDPDVKRLQEKLNRDPDTRIAASGPGSQRNETDFFGSLTEQAVQRFQIKHGIVSFGTPDTTGYGRVGPRTRVVLNR